MAFKMKGSSLYGKLNLNRSGYNNKPDGRAKSSTFQKKGKEVDLNTANIDYDAMTKEQVRDAVIKHNRKGPKTSISMAHAMRMWNKAQERKGKDLKKFSDLEKFDDDRG
jgi:hypothetical protein